MPSNNNNKKSINLIKPFLLLLTSAMTLSAGADPFPPTLGNGAAHFSPVAWPSEPSDITTCGASCGEWKPYTRFQAGVADPRTQDPSNGGTAPQNYVNIASSCIDKSFPSVYYNLHKHPTDPTQDVLMFRWRVEQIANNYATGPSAGNFGATDPWSSALWTVLFDIDGSGYRTLAAHLNGSSGDPSHPVDMLAGIWGAIPTQSIDYLTDPNIKLIAHNPTAFTSGSQILNFHNSLSPDTTWPAGSSTPGTTYDYGTTRSRVVSTSPCNEYFVDYQIPIRMLDASASGPNALLNGPKITRSTPISMLFCTANSLNNPFQKDCAINRAWIADASKPAPFGDYISFDQSAPYAQPIVSSVTASPPSTCPGSYTLEAKVQDALYVDATGTVKPSIKQVQFFYWLDSDGDGTVAGDAGSAWTLAATATLKPGTLNTWTAAWNATGLPKGKYLVGVQAVDDKTLHDDGVPDGPVDNRTFSYMVGSINTATQGQIYNNPWTFDGTTKTWVSGGAGGWVDTQQAAFQTHASVMTPGATENWFGNPAVTGVQTALVGLAVNACGVAPTITKTANPSSVATGQAVSFTVTIANATGGSVKLTQIDDPLPNGFTYASTTSVSNNFVTVTPSTAPTVGASGTVSWVFNGGAGIDVANNTSVVLTFVSNASGTAGTYNNVASAATSLGSISSTPATVGVDAARISLSKTPSTYSINPGGSLTYTLAYSNDSSVPVTSASIADTLPANVSCTNYSINGGGSVACSGTSVSIPLGTVAAGGSGNVVMTVAVGAGYGSTSLLNSATLDVIAPDGSTHVTKTATSTIAVSVPAAAFSLAKTATSAQIAENTDVTWTISYSNYGTGSASNVVISDPLPSGFTYVSSNPAATSAPAVGVNGTVSWNVGTVANGTSGNVQVVAKSTTPFSGTANPVTNTATLGWTGGTSVLASSDVGVTQSGQVCRNYYPDTTTTNVGTLTGNIVGTATPLSGNQNVALTAVPSGGTTLVSKSIAASGSPVETEVGRFYQDPVSAQLVSFDGSSTLTGQIYYSKTGAANEVNAGLILYAKVYDYNPATGAQTLIGATSYTDNGTPSPPISLSSVVPSGSLSKGHRLLIVVSVLMNNNKSTTVNISTHDSRSFIRVCAPPPANLVLQKTASASTLNVTGSGRTLTYTLNYSNTSSATAATNVVLTDALPTGTTYASSSASPAATSTSTPSVGAGGTVTWNFATVAAGASGTASVVVNVPDNLTGTPSITNTASMSSTETTSISASATTGVTGGSGGGTPALSVSKSASKTLLVAGDTVTYTLTVVNTGTGNASGVVVTDDFPDQAWFTYGSCSTVAGSCSQSPVGTLSWNIGSLAAGGSATLTFTMNVAASGIPVGANTLNNTATASDSTYCTSGAVSGCTSNTVTVTVSGAPNLSITKTSLPAIVHPGDVVTYTLVVNNSGSGSATGVVVSDPLPANTVFKAITTAGPGTASFDAIGNRVVFNVGTLASGANATLAFTANVTALASGSTTITNLASATATNSTARNASASSSGTSAPVMTLQKNGPTSVPFPATTLSAAASASSTLFVASSTLLNNGDWIQIANGSGDPIVQITGIAGNVLTLSSAVTAASGSAVRVGAVWAMTYQNTGNADANSVAIADPLPANWVYVGSTPTATSAPAVGANGTVNWAVGTVSPGGSGTVQVTAIPTASGSVTNIATLSASGLANVTGSTVTAAGGLITTKTTSTPSLAAGGVASYSIIVSNTLGSPVAGLTVSDVLSSGFTYKAGTANLVYVGGGTNGAVEPTFVLGDTSQPQWTGLTVAANGSLTINFQADVSASTGPATYQNNAAISNAPAGVGVTPFDPLATTAEDVTVLAAGTGLVQGFVYHDMNGNGTFEAGTDLPLTGIHVNITDSTSTLYTVATDASGFYSRVVSAGSTSVDVVNADLPGGLSLATGNTDPGTVTVVSGGAVRKDTGYTITVSAPDMAISLAGLSSSAQVGVAYTGTFSCTNGGTVDATAATTCTVSGLPAGVSVTGCTISPASATWVAGDAVPVTRTVTCNVSGTPSTAGSVTVNGTTGATNDSNVPNNTASTPINVTAVATAPDMAISLAGLSSSAQVGVAYAGSFSCTNIGTAGASAGTSCTVSGLPAGVGVTGCTISPVSATWVAGDAVPVTRTVTCSVSGTPSTAGSVTVNGTTGATGDSNVPNNTASTPINVTAVATAPDMAISLAGLPGSAQVGALYSGSFTCASIGTANASAGTSCAISGLPAGVSVTTCTISPSASAWVAGNAVPMGQTVTCGVSGTPTSLGNVTLNGSTGATNDSNPANNTASLGLTVWPAVAPSAANDSAVTNYNTPVTIAAFANDNAGTGATLALNSIDLAPTVVGQQTSRTMVGEGTFTANNDGTVTFAPVLGFEGVVTVPYTIRNSLGQTSNVANITVTVRGAANSGNPVAQNDVGSTPPATPVTLTVLGNDAPSTSNTLVPGSVILSGTNGAQGGWVANSGGTVTFTPAGGFVGTATANYTVRDTGGGTSNVATITVAVAGGALPAAQNDSASTSPATAVTLAILSNDTAGSGQVLNPSTVVLGGTTPANGSWVVNADGTVTFTPAVGFSGVATANYTVRDSGGNTTNTATITITVNPVAPVATDDVAPAGVRTLSPANNDTASAGAVLNPSTVDLDPGTPGIQRLFVVTGQGTWQVIDNNGTVLFSPVAGFYGTARLTYAITDSLGNTATAMMSVPIDPSGVVYDSTARLPIVGATVTLLYNGASANAFVTTGNATMTTNAAGQYAFFLVPAAPAGTYSLVVNRTGYVFQSVMIPPAAGGWPAGGGAITPVVGAPTGGQPTTYYLLGPLPATDIINNNIPLDPVVVGPTAIPTLSQWGLILLTGLMALLGMTRVRRKGL